MRFWLYITQALWRVHRGRWYVWRDVPTDIVRKAAALWFVARNDKEPSPEIVSLVHQARSEAKLRARRGDR